MNAEEKRAYVKQWCKDNAERKAAVDKAWRSANRERVIEGKRAWRAKNIEKAREYARRWARENREKMNLTYQTRRARQLAAPGTVSKDITSRLLLLQKGKCANCWVSIKGGYHLDHITPLAKGGAHDDSNLQLLCPSCNYKKNAKDPIEWAQAQGRLL